MGEERRQERRKHIFAINGSPDFLNIVRDLFQEEDYNVTTTNFVPNSFAQIQALHAEAETNDIPVLVLSTSPRLLERAREQAERYGNHRYLDKPFDLEALLTNIRGMVGGA